VEFDFCVVWFLSNYLCERKTHYFSNNLSSPFFNINVGVEQGSAVVATTRQNSTHSLLTSAKLSDSYLVVGITKELDKEPSLHCSSIYLNYM